MRTSRTGILISGILVGAASGVATVVLLAALSIFVAVSKAQDTRIIGVAETNYIEGANGGFELGFGLGPAAFVVIALAAALGAVLALAVPRRSRNARTDVATPA